MNNINMTFINGCNKTISELSYQDMLKAQPKNRKAMTKIKHYSLSQNTLYLLETKQAYIKGDITEEEAKTIFLRQKMSGNVI